MNSLISFDGLADVANNLIDKLSEAIGWIATSKTPKQIAIDTYISDIQKSENNPLVKAALISQAKKTIKEYNNQYDVVNIALHSIKADAHPELLDTDWVAQFMDKVRLVSNEDFKIMWGNLLAEECNMPGSIPKALLHVMEQMDKGLANAFMAVAAVSVNYIDNGKKEYTPIIVAEKMESYYKSIGVSLDNLINLQAIGLIKQSGELSGYGLECSDSVVIRYYDEEYHLPNNCTKFGIGNVVYTKIGQTLCNVVSPEKIDGFFESICIPLFEKKI